MKSSTTFFPKAGYTKLDLVRYYVAVAEGAIRGVAGRPMALKRFVNGAEGDFFFQKRAPLSRPEWIETVELAFPSGRTAEEVVVRDAAQLAWVINLGCIDLNPHPVRTEDLDTFVADHFVRPTLIGSATRLPFLWVLLGILGGLETFGIVGLFLGPAVMAALISLWRDWTDMAVPEDQRDTLPPA